MTMLGTTRRRRKRLLHGLLIVARPDTLAAVAEQCTADATTVVHVLPADADVMTLRQWRRNVFTERLRLLGETPMPEHVLQRWWPGTHPMRTDY